jgi:transposase InsO family protein
VLGINRSTVYYESKRQEDVLTVAVLLIFDKHNGNYGSRRIRAVLKQDGIIASKSRICKILKENGRESKYGRKRLARNIHTNKDERYIAENLTLGVKATRKGQICHSDFSEFRYNSGKLQVSGIIDAYDKTAVAKWSDRATKELVEETLKMLPKPPEIFHTDRGSQYTSNAIRLYAEKNGIKRSMSAPYCSYQNAMIETFWKTLKVEIGETKHLTKEELIMVLEYQVYYYNNERIHSALNYLTPARYSVLNGASPIQNRITVEQYNLSF